MIENPFESGHIKNYVLLYASIVVIMVLFFIASTLFNDVKKVDKKVFNTKVVKKETDIKSIDQNITSKFKLLKEAY